MAQAFYVFFGEPVIKKNNRPIFVNKKTNKHFTGKSDKLAFAEQRILYEAAKQMKEHGYKTLKGNLRVTFAVMLDHNRVKDLSNCFEIFADCLQKAGAIKNDNDIVILNQVKYRGLKKGDGIPAVTILIEEIGELPGPYIMNGKERVQWERN